MKINDGIAGVDPRPEQIRVLFEETDKPPEFHDRHVT